MLDRSHPSCTLCRGHRPPPSILFQAVGVSRTCDQLYFLANWVQWAKEAEPEYRNSPASAVDTFWVGTTLTFFPCHLRCALSITFGFQPRVRRNCNAVACSLVQPRQFSRIASTSYYRINCVHQRFDILQLTEFLVIELLW